jgi:DNA-binding transcriptional regulator YiaG
MSDPNDLAAYIRSQRKLYGMTQASLASRAQVPPAQVKRIESAREVPMQAAIRILRALEPTPRTL